MGFQEFVNVFISWWSIMFLVSTVSIEEEERGERVEDEGAEGKIFH